MKHDRSNVAKNFAFKINHVLFFSFFYLAVIRKFETTIGVVFATTGQD